MDGIWRSEGPAIEPAWERRPEIKLFPAFFSTIREVLFEPGPTFSRLPITGQLMRPTTFYLMLLAIQSALGYLFYAVYIPFLFSSGEFQRSGVSAGVLGINLSFWVLLWGRFNLG